jgi:hypothetical protein
MKGDSLTYSLSIFTKASALPAAALVVPSLDERNEMKRTKALGKTTIINSRNYDNIPAIFDSLYLLYFVKVRDCTLNQVLRRTLDSSNATTKLAHARIFWRGKEA